MLIYINIKPYKSNDFATRELLKNKKMNGFIKKGMILVSVKINDTIFCIFHQKI